MAAVQPKYRKIKKVMIANRGEVALRIIRAIKELGLQAVVAYEKPDSDAYFIRFAEEAIMIGEGPIKDYLDIDKMIWAARKTGADAIHPGYGFLSENADFAQACEDAGIIFIGPPSRVLKTMGNKVSIREIMQSLDIPVIPGTGLLQQGKEGMREALEFGKKHGYPVMVKSITGGGGRGVRRARSGSVLLNYMNRIWSKPWKSWKDGIYLEKYMTSVKHVEIQILADYHGNVIHLGSRDASIQRRHQTLLVMAPANIPESILERLYADAVKAVRHTGYVNAGTVEFLVNTSTGEYWFIAMNRRLEVEHTVTEELTNVDIVREQICIAQGEPLDIPQERVTLLGNAIEVRINAEDPQNKFLPEGGKLIELYMPPGGPGIRMDGILYQGYKIPPQYDPLLVKMTIRAYDWDQVVGRLESALDSFLIVGPQTTIPFYRAVCDDPDFRRGDVDTRYIHKFGENFKYPDPVSRMVKLESFFMDLYTAEFFPHSWL
jgi:acetyl/propionyl-CoA carboxylase alpha subunit